MADLDKEKLIAELNKEFRGDRPQTTNESRLRLSTRTLFSDYGHTESSPLMPSVQDRLPEASVHEDDYRLCAMGKKKYLVLRNDNTDLMVGDEFRIVETSSLFPTGTSLIVEISSVELGTGDNGIMEGYRIIS